jgi:hypothetical protein
VSVRIVDEASFGLGWIEDTPQARASHALAVDGRVWLVDPIEPAEAEERVLALGEPAGVIQLLDRHNRSCAAVAARLGVPHHVVPAELPGTPFELLPLVRWRFWREAALWWPAERVLVCADALGTAPFFRAGDEPVGVHPMLRFAPPRALVGLGPEHVLVGHGEGLHGPKTGALVDDAVRQARRRIPRWLRGIPRIVRRGY